MKVWQQAPDAPKRLYENKLLKNWTEANEAVAAMEAATTVTSRRKAERRLSIPEAP